MKLNPPEHKLQTVGGQLQNETAPLINLNRMTDIIRTLEQQKEEFKQKKLVASPIAGLIAWLTVAISGLLFSDIITIWVLFVATGSIGFLAMSISKLTGETILIKAILKILLILYFSILLLRPF